MTEALWAHQYQDVVNLELLDRVLASPDFHARAAATRVLCVWRDRVPGALDTLKKLAADPYPLVRLEAVRAASFFPVAEAVEVPLISADHPTDEYLDYTRGETMKTLEPYWRKAIAAGKPIAVTSEAGTRFFLGRLSIDELLKMKRTRGIDLELLLRKGVREEIRREALADLAKLDKKPELTVLLEAIKALDDRAGEGNDAVAFDLGRLLTGRDAAELTDRPARPGRPRDGRPQAGHPAAWLSRPDRRRRGRRQGLDARLEVGRLAPRPGRRHARDPRSRPACGALSQGLAAARRACRRRWAAAPRRRRGPRDDSSGSS